MATVEKPVAKTEPEPLDPEGFPWLENGERMDATTFLDRYEQTPHHVHAELIEGTVYVMPSPLRNRHGRSSMSLSACLFLYSAATPGTEGQDNTTTVLGEESVPQPDSALLILSEYGGQTRDGTGDDDYTYGAPELIVEVAFSSRSIDLHGKFRDYERAGAREYVVFDLRPRALRWFVLRDEKFEPLGADADGVFRSHTFPGLWINGTALATRDKAALIATVQNGLASPEHAAFVAELERRRAEGNRG